MFQVKEIGFVLAVFWVTFIPPSKSVGLVGLENFLEEKQIFLTQLNKEITSLQERIKIPEQQWYFEESCKMTCKIFACLFTRKPASEKELCEQPGKGEDACCEKYANGEAETPEAAPAEEVEVQSAIPKPGE